MITTNLSEIDQDYVTNLYLEESKSIDWLSKFFGRSPDSIKKILISKDVNVRVSKLATNKQFREWYSQEKSLSEIANLLGVKEASVKKMYKTLGLIKGKYAHITEEVVGYIKNDYATGMSSRAIAKKYNISKTTVLAHLKDNSVEMKDNSFYSKYDFDKTFFDKIDTEEKAYFLGYLYADGYNNQERGCISLGQADKDKESVYKFKTVLKATHEISVEEKSKKDGNLQDFYKITLYDRRFSDNLAKLGVIQGKTFDLTFPTFLSDDLIHHFIRGYFDGDGSIWESNGVKNMSITGFDVFIKRIQKHLIESGGLNRTKLTSRRKNHIVDIRYGGSGNIKKIKDYLYKDASIYLQRKFEKF